MVRSETYKVASDEVLVVEVTVASARKNVEVLGQSDKATEEKCNDGSPETEGSDVGQLVVGDALSTACADEPNVRNEQRDPGQQTEDGSKVDEVAENDRGFRGSVHESGAAEEC